MEKSEENRRIYDVTISIRPSMPTFPNDPKVNITRISEISKGRTANVSLISFGSHTGTHIDSPYHFIEEGIKVDELPLEVLIGEAFVYEIETDEVITADHLENLDIPFEAQRILLKTNNSDLWRESPTEFRKDYISLRDDAARWIVQRGIKLVGVDYLSVGGLSGDGVQVHRTLLAAGVIIVEGLNLAEVEPGRYQLVCLPMKIEGGDGAPARVILLES